MDTTLLLKKEWHPFKNGNLTLDDFSESSAKKVWWQCKDDSRHEWETRVFARRKNGQGCPFCKGKRVLPENGFANKYKNLMSEWDYDKNKIDPTILQCRSGKKIWWKCKKGHEWQTTVIHRTKNGTGCPYCVNQKVCIENSILSTKSPILKEWHPTKNIDIDPSKVTSNSHKKVWWKCKKAADHEWEATICNRFSKNGSGCPCCAGRKVVLSNCVETTHPNIAREWHSSKNTFSPRDVTYASNKKVWWKCSNDNSHEWKARIDSRIQEDTGCPLCASSKGEKSIKEHLESLNINYTREHRIDECRYIRPLPFDFALFNNNEDLIGLIEFQGRHHYSPIDYFGGEKQFKIVKRNDQIKEDYCKENGIKLLLIPFTKQNDIEYLINDFLEEV